MCWVPFKKFKVLILTSICSFQCSLTAYAAPFFAACSPLRSGLSNLTCWQLFFLYYTPDVHSHFTAQNHTRSLALNLFDSFTFPFCYASRSRCRVHSCVSSRAWNNRRLWWAQVDSNHRPHAYQACALTGWAMSPHCWSIALARLFSLLCLSPLSFASRLLCSFLECRYFAGIKRSKTVVEMSGIEPLTPCLQGRCSPSWATPPSRVVLFCYLVLKLNYKRSLKSTNTI